jgi:hypothetical protein
MRCMGSGERMSRAVVLVPDLRLYPAERVEGAPNGSDFRLVTTRIEGVSTGALTVRNGGCTRVRVEFPTAFVRERASWLLAAHGFWPQLSTRSRRITPSGSRRGVRNCRSDRAPSMLQRVPSASPAQRHLDDERDGNQQNRQRRRGVPAEEHRGMPPERSEVEGRIRTVTSAARAVPAPVRQPSDASAAPCPASGQ